MEVRLGHSDEIAEHWTQQHNEQSMTIAIVNTSGFSKVRTQLQEYDSRYLAKSKRTTISFLLRRYKLQILPHKLFQRLLV